MRHSLPDCLIFDWDGTLANSLDIIIKAFQTTACELGLDEPDALLLQNSMGEPPTTVIQRLYPELYTNDFAERFLTCFRAHYGKHSHSIQLLPSVLEVLQKLYLQGKTLAIASNKSKLLLETELEATQVRMFFSSIKSISDYPGKPNPAMLQAIMNETHHTPTQCLMIGDHHNDLLAARACQMRSLAVLTGSQDRCALSSYNPDFILKSASELLSAFNLQAQSTQENHE